MNYRVLGTDGRAYGPATADQVRTWIRERRVDGSSLAQADGSVEWRPISFFPEFQSAFVPPTAAPFAPAPLPPGMMPRTNSLAVWGLIMGLLTVTCGGCCWYGFPINLLGIILSSIALSQINNNPQMERGKGMAIAGLILSILGTIIGILAGIFLNIAAIASNFGNWGRYH